ncbi:MAG: winged helix-turn-helix domain-containing protein [Gemmatimonadetes bacterium]|nr:winged helix-turn-helix domain-containing protein [Gemmatimonadota bacterium]
MTASSLPASVPRQLLLAAQGLDRAPRRRATKADVLAAIQRMGALQIDTIHVVARSPYLVLFSRLGRYQAGWLDELLSERQLFEYWAHEACLLPIEDYPLYRHRMDAPQGMGWKYRAHWVAEHGHELANVLAHMRERGEVRSADFARRDGRPGSWWEWKPEKRALEALFTAGQVMGARRHNFQRVYDVRERVHPAWNDAPLSADVAMRQLALGAVRALGITTARWVADYFRMDRKRTPAVVAALAAEGALREVRVAGWSEPAYLHPDHEALADAAAAGKLSATRTAFLSPFDPVVWDRGRTRVLFGFDYALECYLPAPKRRWGYFVLPLLRRGQLIGRMDAKAHRRDGRFEVKVLQLEESVRSSGALVRDIARALRELAEWHGTPDVDVRRTSPGLLRRVLAAQLA